MARRYIVRLVLGIVTLIAFVALIGAIYFRYWDAATTCATLLVGLIAADVVVWQGYVIKRQLAFDGGPANRACARQRRMGSLPSRNHP